MEKKTRLIRTEYNGINSIFFIKAQYVTDVWDTESNKLKYVYTIVDEKLTILGDYEAIYVLYE